MRTGISSADGADDFKEVSGSPLVARLAIEYELRDAKTGTTVWSHYYSHDEPAEGKEVTAVVAALDKNVQGIVGQVKAGLEQYLRRILLRRLAQRSRRAI